MHPVLSIPELLDLIFSFMDRASNVNNACVCRQWSEIALDNLWREVDNLLLLFSVLAPLQDNQTGYAVSSYFSPRP
jgi:hypothetical protein